MAIIAGLNKRLAEVGKIKIGKKGEEYTTQNNKKARRTVKLPHFIVTTTEREETAEKNFIPDPDVMGKLGKEPKEISIRLPFDDIDMNFFTEFQRYDGHAAWCKGDGKKARRIDKNGAWQEIECKNQECPELQAKRCKVTGILSCYLPSSPHYGGVYRFRTHGWNMVSGILAALEDISRNTGGILQGLPLKLKMIKKATEKHGNINIVTLVLDGIEMQRMRELAATEKQSRKMLDFDIEKYQNEIKAAGFDPEENDEPAEVVDEFYNDEAEDPLADDAAGVSSDEALEELEAADQEPEGAKEPPKEKSKTDLF